MAMTGTRVLNSQIVVISWWSNCLGLACLQRLAKFTNGRRLNVVQVGKSAAQKLKFRTHLPPGVNELPYPEDSPGEHSRVIREVCFRLLPSAEGVWFIDHDVFFEGDCEDWFRVADACLSGTDACLCLPLRPPTPAITQPTFWLAPAYLPAGIPSFDPIPFQAQNTSRRPDLYRNNGDLRMPLKDTLVQVRDELTAAGKVSYFPLCPQEAAGNPMPPFPRHTHLGGLFFLAGPTHPTAFESWPAAGEWSAKTVRGLEQFFERCPPEWLAIEEPVLLQRLAEFREAWHV
jgi:hypothetical protein